MVPGYSPFKIDKLLLEHVGLPQVLDISVHLVNFFGWMSQGSHCEQLLLFALFYQSAPSCLKVGGGGGGGVGWPKILVSAPVPLELILTGFDWVGSGPWGFGFWDGP